MLARLRGGLGAVLVALVSSTAWGADVGWGTWMGGFFQGKFTDYLGWYLESQVRLSDGWARTDAAPDPIRVRGNRLLLRPALRWMPWGNGDFQIHVGYGFTPNLSPERFEHRIWQQVLRQHDDGDWAWGARARLEERWIEAVDGTSMRLRLWAKCIRYLYKKGDSDPLRLGPVVWDEGFFNLYSVPGGPQAGLDQNRAFLGLAAQVDARTKFEVGYMNLILPQGTASDWQMQHTAVLYFFVDLP